MPPPQSSSVRLADAPEPRFALAGSRAGQVSQSAVSLKQIAAHTGCSLATVSYALRGNPKISESKTSEIRRAAIALGYRPNPRVSNLMAHIRRTQQRPFGEKIAFVWVHTSRALARQDSFLRAVYSGAKARAEQAGLGLEEFYTNDLGMTDGRLEQIITSRGITGVILSPVTTNESAISVKWNWSNFSPAVIGNVSWTPELHHAGHHHYLGMRTALAELEKCGCSRPAAIIEPESNLRSKRAWEAAFIMHHPLGIRARPLLATPPAHKHALVAKWVEKVRPDSLIVSATSLLEAPGLQAVCQFLNLSVSTLYWTPDSKVSGVDQCYERIAAHAVDLVIAQLNSNETGVPDLPRMMLFPGRWAAANQQGHISRRLNQSSDAAAMYPSGLVPF